MSDTKHDTTDHEARIKWLEQELTRIAFKVDKTVHFGDAYDTPTPRPTDALPVDPSVAAR
jgi:hypothetical protein